MKILEFVKGNLRDTLLTGVDETIASLKGLIPKHSQKHHDLILLQSQLNDIKRKSLQGVITDEQSQLGKNKVRALLMDFINDLTESDLNETEETPTEKKSQPDTTPNSEAPISSEKEVFHRAKKWSVEMVENNKLDNMKFQVQLSQESHVVELIVTSSGERIEVDGQVVYDEKLNLANVLGGIFTLVTTNQETKKFKLSDGKEVYDAALSYGVNVSKSIFIKIKFLVADQLLFSQ